MGRTGRHKVRRQGPGGAAACLHAATRLPAACRGRKELGWAQEAADLGAAEPNLLCMLSSVPASDYCGTRRFCNERYVGRECVLPQEGRVVYILAAGREKEKYDSNEEVG